MINSIKSFRLLVLLALVSLTACAASTVEVQGSYPSPNVPPLPLTLGVYYSDDLRNYIYTELSDTGKEEYLVAAGNTHMELFNTVLPAMFSQVVVLNNPTEAGARGVDAVFMPQIDEFQLGMPQKTRLDAYEVWIKYNMRMTGADGSYVADWVMTAYGKSTQGNFTSAERGINDAAVAALRDLASNFSISFRAVPDIRDWLSRQQLQLSGN
ncbi:hypothetical protein [Pseudohongiella spirulinae]|uniref:Lipoprotein n=1 Tax=Pseudohongiella spirulinae TaxID=1249552 RepID=A0A0S2KHI5_9GAMM|nr:hypothetical protein [Pseudohongiella spirulinae]ALO47566.1 hypothetical protein PS2015_2939 [Pseudohongiella spirulinae]